VRKNLILRSESMAALQADPELVDHLRGGQTRGRLGFTESNEGKQVKVCWIAGGQYLWSSKKKTIKAL